MNTKYIYNSVENKSFLHDFALSMLSFGKQYASPGGSVYWLSHNGTPMPEKDRFTYNTARFVHCYCMGTFLGFPNSRELAQAGLDGLRNELWDKENGGWYYLIHQDGQPDREKSCYTHAFVILAACSAIEAGLDGAEELLQRAVSVYDKYFWNEEEGLSCDIWNDDFSVCDPYRGLNANMHTVEAFLAAADTTKDEKYRVRAGRIIDRVLQWAQNNEYRIPEHYTENWSPMLEVNKEKPDDAFKPYGATPGHGIEWSRLIVQYALSSYNREGAQPYIEFAEKLYRRAISDGWNCDGQKGIVYTTKWDGSPSVHDRMSWVMAEALNTSSVLFRVTGKEQYSNDFSMFLEYVDQTFMDHEEGSWFHQLDQNNQLLETVWPGKNDIYHIMQSMLIPYAKDPSISICPELKLEKA